MPTNIQDTVSAQQKHADYSQHVRDYELHQSAIKGTIDCHNCAKRNDANLWLIVAWILFMISLIIMLNEHFNKTVKKFLQTREKKKLLKTIQEKVLAQEERKKELKTAIKKVAILSHKKWYELDKNKKHVINPETLKQLQQIMEDYEQQEQALNQVIGSVSEQELEKNSSLQKEISLRKRFNQHKKAEKTSPSSNKENHAKTEKMIMNGSALFSNYSSEIYTLKSGKRCVYINPLLLQYLKIKDEKKHLTDTSNSTVNILEGICRTHNDRIIKKSEKQSVFIFREAQNAKKLDRSLSVSPQTAKSFPAEVVKAKDPHTAIRYYGESVASKNGVTLFQINSVKFDKQKKQGKGKLISFP